MTAALAALALSGCAGVAACRKAQAGTPPGGTERQDPYALMKREFFDNPQRFQVAMAQGAAASVRRSLPDATLTFEEQAVVTNLGQALRAIVAYRGEMPAPGGGTLSLDAEQRQYLHPNGAVIVDVACFGSSCKVPRELIDHTDATALQHLADEGVSSLLPPGAACETSPVQMRGHTSQMTVCRVGPAVQVSVVRLSRDQTLDEFASR